MMTYEYDTLSRNRKTTDNTLGTFTQTTYDTAGRPKTQIDAKNQTMTYQLYDVLDRPLDVQDRLSHVTKRRYNTVTGGDEFVDTVEDATGKVTTYTLDKLGRRKYVDLASLDHGQQLFKEQRTEFVYDAAGRQSEIMYFEDKDDTNPVAKRVYTYESPSGNLLKIEYREDDNIDGADVLVGTDLFDYNDVLQRDLATQHDGDELSPVKHQLDWDYTLRGQVFKETTTYATQPYVVENRFDGRGRLAKVIYPSGREVDYTYTERSEVDTIDWAGSQIEDRDYTDLGQLWKITRPGFSGQELRTHNGRRLTQIDAGNMGLGTIDYDYDDNNNKTEELFAGNSVLDHYDFNTGTNGYDAEDRFTKFNRPGQGETNIEFKRWVTSATEPSIGNIVNITGGVYSGTREFNDIHQLGGAGVVAQTQTFDDVGNLTAAENGNSYAWNMAAGRMESATASGNDQYYRYDAAGRRAWKETNDGTTNTKTVFIYSGPNCIAEYNEGAVFSTPGNEYVYAGGIDSLAMVVHNNNAKRLSVIRNQQWSVIGLVNIVTATIEELYSYNVFGERTILDPGTANSRTASSFKNPYGYTSRRHDDETGLMYYRARYYDPTTGEFISKDPLEYVDGMSMYRAYFVPNGVDPSGAVCIKCYCQFNQDRKNRYWVETDCVVGKPETCCKNKCSGSPIKQFFWDTTPVWLGEELGGGAVAPCDDENTPETPSLPPGVDDCIRGCDKDEKECIDEIFDLPKPTPSPDLPSGPSAGRPSRFANSYLTILGGIYDNVEVDLRLKKCRIDAATCRKNCTPVIPCDNPNHPLRDE